MGCCFSCFNSSDNKSQSGEPNERTTLLGNPVSNSIGRPLFNQDFSEVVSGPIADEQAALNKILHKTAIDIIDVSAIPTHIEQKDFIDRVKLYQKRLLVLQSRPSLRDKCIVRDLPFPEKSLSESPMLLADLQMANEPAGLWVSKPLFSGCIEYFYKEIEDVFKEAYNAFKAIQIEPQGDVVTKFGIS